MAPKAKASSNSALAGSKSAPAGSKSAPAGSTSAPGPRKAAAPVTKDAAPVIKDPKQLKLSQRVQGCIDDKAVNPTPKQINPNWNPGAAPEPTWDCA